MLVSTTASSQVAGHLSLAHPARAAATRGTGSETVAEFWNLTSPRPPAEPHSTTRPARWADPRVPGGRMTCARFSGTHSLPAQCAVLTVVEPGLRHRSPRIDHHPEGPVLAAHDDLAFGLGEPAPDPVGLVHGQGVRAALGQHRAARADLLRLGLPTGSGRAALPLGMEEHRAVHPTARATYLPIPDTGNREGAFGCLPCPPLHLSRTTCSAEP